MITVLAVFGVIFILLLLRQFFKDAHSPAMNEVMKKPYYIPISNIRKDGVYAIENVSNNLINVIAFLATGRISWFSVPIPDKTYEGAVNFNKQVQKKLNDYNTWSYNEYTEGSNAYIGNFKNLNSYVTVLKCKPKGDGDLQVFISEINSLSDSTTTWYDYKFVKLMVL